MFEDILKISLAILALTRRDAGKHWRAFLFLLQLLKLIAHRPQAFPRNTLIGLVDVDFLSCISVWKLTQHWLEVTMATIR